MTVDLLSGLHCHQRGFSGGAVVRNLLPKQESQETWIRSLGRGDPPGVANGNSLQYSRLKNPKDRGA